MKTALLLLLLFCVAEADDVRFEVNDMLQKFKSSMEEQHAGLASRLSASETKMEAFQARLSKSEKLVEELQQYKAANNKLTLENSQLQSANNNLTLQNSQLEIEVKQLNSHHIADKSCPSGWKTFADSCYYRTVAEKTWEQSREYCRSHGADLVIINSSEEKVFIRGLSISGYRAWIGLTRTEGSWTWVDGTPLTTQYWAWGQPRHHEDYNCAAYDNWTVTGVMFNALCSDTKASICEK